ncbi:MAG TPA: hypothetical protein VMG10_12900 [Gemmataceae bacterium]|nr:hypothetical protein [Gemmataceae bacterium]
MVHRLQVARSPQRQQGRPLLALRAGKVCSVLLLWASAAAAAPPVVRNVDRLGLQIGGSTTLTIDGENLLPEPKLLLSAPIVKQVVQPKATANRVVIEVTLDKTATPGPYNLRLANVHGVSAGRVVAVDHLPQRTWETKVASLLVSLHGSLSGSNKLTTSFAGKAGQAILCEVEAQRLGGKLRPVLHLQDERGRELAWTPPTPSLGGDARLTATLPADGTYTIEVHDSLYAAGSPGNLRLKLGSWQYVDAVFPAAVRRGQSASIELLGNTPGQRAQIHAATGSAVMPVPWADAGKASGLRPRVLVSDLPEMIEKDGGAIQAVESVPAALNGRISKEGESDRFRLKVTPGAKLRFEVFADRLGSPMDAVLKLHRDSGTLLAQGDDSPGSTDPILDFTVPAGVQSLVTVIEDVHGRGQPSFIYRLVVQPITANSGIKDYRLYLPTAELNVPLAGSNIIEVEVERRGYQGPIRLGVDGLPDGVQVQGLDVPAGASGALLTFTGTGSSPGFGLASLHGDGTEAKTSLVRIARERDHPLRTLQPWLAEEMAVALTPKEKIDFAAAWGDVPADASLVPGAKLKVPLKLTPPKEVHGGVRFYLLSSHTAPLVNGRPDPNQSLRKDQGQFLELPAGKTQGEFVVLLPATLSSVPQDLAFRADLLSKDRARVISQAFTPVRRFNVLNPLVVKAAATQIEAALDAKAGAEVRLAGKVERRGGFKGDVTVSLNGVPPGIAVPRAVVKDGQSDFQLVLRFPGNFKAQELSNLEIFATGKYSPQTPLLNRSEPVAVRVKLTPKATTAKK